jgi:sigma-B regulation protein RsbU (phosphoserine phosphatase)
VFASLYGIRLAADSEFLRALFGAGPRFWAYLDAFITYLILTPAALFLSALLGPGWHGALRRTWQALLAYAAFAIAHDLVRGESAAMWMNVPAVVVSVGIGLAHLFARWREQAWWSAEARVALAGGLLFTAAALYETFAGGGLLGEGVDLEPIAMLVFLGSLGYFVGRRIVAGEQRLASVSRELELARQIQRSLLPRSAPAIPGLRVATRYLPMGEVAGDFYDFQTARPNTLGLVVADVSGHGVPAALVASMVKVAFAAESARHEAPGLVLQNMNRTLCGKFERAYVTACCGLFTESGKHLAYSLAGHPAPLVRRAEGGIERLDQGGLPLTFDPEAPYPTAEVTLSPGDRLLFFTDGLVEAPNAKEEFFGDARLEQTFADGTGLSAEEFAERLVAEVRHWIGADASLHDDVTVVVVDITHA